MDAKHFDELMTARHSVRYFQKKEIPEKTLKEIIGTALKSPSWCNSQSWNIYVASGKTLSEIRNIWISKNNKGISWCKDCIIAEPYIKNSKKLVLDNNYLWINIQIDKEKKYLYQYNHYLKLSILPTLIYFKNGKEICRLVQQSLFNQEKINNFILKCLKNNFY